MEDKKANIIAVSLIITLVAVIIIARFTLKPSMPFFVVVGAAVSLIFAVISFAVVRLRYSNKRKLLESKIASEGRELRIEYSFLRKVAGVPTKYKYKELQEATDNFNFQKLLGRGSSGTVYKGILSDGTDVAVKKIEGREKAEKEFTSEVAAIASVQHKNLIRLLGYCSSSCQGPRFLVYEFIPNGSLDCWIFPGRRQRYNGCRSAGGCLSWDLRYRVAVDVARALAYLHHDCRSKILHLDVKPENILLDENHRAIVTDFGLSKLMDKDESRVVTNIRGTRGYLAPEWLMEHGISEKSDVYSFGMVLLEIMGGRRNISRIEVQNNHRSKRKKWQYFPRIVNEKMRQGKIMETVDPRLVEAGGIDEREVTRLVYVAMWCIQERAKVRPSMAKVVEMLEGRIPVKDPPDTDMVIVDLLSADDDSPPPEGNNSPLRIFPLGIQPERKYPPQLSYSYTAMSSVHPR